MNITDRLQTNLGKRMKLEPLSPERLEEIEMLDRGMVMLASLELRKEIWNLESREKAGKWVNWLQAEGYRYDDMQTLSVSFYEENSQPIMSFRASRFPKEHGGLFQIRSEHTVCFLFSPNGDLLKCGDTFDDCPENFSTAEFVAIAPDSMSCWSNRQKYPSDSCREMSESSRAFAKAFIVSRRIEASARPDLDDDKHVAEGKAFSILRKKCSYLGEIRSEIVGTIGIFS